MLTGNVDSRGKVVAGAGAEDDGDGARSCGLPGQIKGLASSDAVVVGVCEGVAVGKSQQGRGHEGDEGLGRETHLGVWCGVEYVEERWYTSKRQSATVAGTK